MRKPLLLLLITLLSSHLTHAQTYHPFKFDLGAGTALQSRGGSAILYMEPNWNFKNYRVGLRNEAAILYMKNEMSMMGTVDRFLLPQKNEFRPFVGAGIGYYWVSESGSCGGGFDTRETTHNTKPLGGMLRAGFNWEILRLSVEYNIVQDTYVRDYSLSKVLIGTQTYSSSYIGIKAAISIRRSMASLRRRPF